MDRKACVNPIRCVTDCRSAEKQKNKSHIKTKSVENATKHDDNVASWKYGGVQMRNSVSGKKKLNGTTMLFRYKTENWTSLSMVHLRTHTTTDIWIAIASKYIFSSSFRFVRFPNGIFFYCFLRLLLIWLQLLRLCIFWFFVVFFQLLLSFFQCTTCSMGEYCVW